MNRKKLKEHILVCLSASPSNPKVIKSAAKMAKAFDADFTALYIETSPIKRMSEEDKQRLEKNTLISKENGAKIVTICADDIAYQVSQYAKTSGVTRIVIGRSGYRANRFFAPPNYVDKLIELTPEIDIYIIPDKIQKLYMGQKYTKEKFKLPSLSLKDSVMSIFILFLAALAGAIFYTLNINESNIIMVFIFAVMLIAYFTKGKVYSLISSFLAVIIFNFFFTKPYLSFMSTDSGYPVTFLIMFTVAFFISSITKKVKQQAEQSGLKAFRTEVMLDMSQKLQQTKNIKEIENVTVEQIKKLLGGDVVLFDSDDCTEDGKYTYYPVRNSDTVFAYAGITRKEISEYEKSLLFAMLRESALTYEKEQINAANNELIIKHKQEELRSALLRAVSHDLRTPLTGICGNAELLMTKSSLLAENKKHEIYKDVYEDSIWLLNLVENLLSITRFDNENMTIKKEPEYISDVIREALFHLGRQKENYTIAADIQDEDLCAKMDGRLISQVIFNLVDNAMKYSPSNNNITVGAKSNGKDIEIFVKDEGAGISDEDKKHIFDMFYTVKNSISDGRRGLGLGLALCKTVVNAHGGEIVVQDNKPKGTVFSFCLKGEFDE